MRNPTTTPGSASLVLLPLLALLACGDPGARASGGDEAAAPSRASGPPAATAAGANADPSAVCNTIDNSFRCARAIEAVQLPRSDRVARRGDTLRLALEAGDTVRLVDRPAEGSDALLFSYQDHWADAGWFVVHEQHYEGSEFLLIGEAAGERVRVPARPLPAPDGERFAVLSFDLEAGYAPNTLQIWRLNEGEATLEWAIEPDTWGPVGGRWMGPETLMFTRRCGPLSESAADCGAVATLRRDATAWTFDPGGP